MTKAVKQGARRDAGRPRGEAIIEAVLSRTLDELAVHGIDKLSVGRIARVADVNKTSVYRRWPTRSALVAAALERVRNDVSGHLQDTGSLRGDLMVLARNVATFLGGPVGRELAHAALGESAGPELAALAARQLESQVQGPVHDMVQRARARGEWREDVEPRMLLAMIVGALLHRSMLEHATLSKPWLASLIDVVLLGVTPMKAPRGAAVQEFIS